MAVKKTDPDKVLQINMLGEFSLTYGDRSVNSQSNRSKKLWTFLEYLITFHDREVSQDELIEILWPNDEVENPANTLKTLLHRVRSTVDELGENMGKQLVHYHQGAYTWNNAFPCRIDIVEFDRLIKQANTLQDEERKLQSMLEAIELYRGDFLVQSASELWTTPLNTYYKTQYIKLVLDATNMLFDNERHSEAIAICQRAVVIAPYDENVHYLLIQALVQTGQRQAALDHYQYTTDLFFSHLGITPSEQLTTLYRNMIKTSKDTTMDLDLIREGLREKEDDSHAFFCEYEVFKDIYQLQIRSASRTGHVIHIALLSVFDEGGNKLEQAVLNNVMRKLKSVVGNTLRRGDTITRYSVSQFLIMLPSASFENGNKVMQRIVQSFKRTYPRLKVSLTYKLLPLDPLE